VGKKASKHLQINTDNAANADTLEQVGSKTLPGLVRARDPKTGEVIPRVLAMVAPPQSEEFSARVISFRPKRSPQEIPLVEILRPASSGGMKGLTFRVDQLPGLIRALQQAQAGAVERGLIDKPVGQ
jgi:hypothetical protein